jgi:hypothetical protein
VSIASLLCVDTTVHILITQLSITKLMSRKLVGGKYSFPSLDWLLLIDPPI